jgi:hypothetical protein
MTSETPEAHFWTVKIVGRTGTVIVKVSVVAATAREAIDEAFRIKARDIRDAVGGVSVALERER